MTQVRAYKKLELWSAPPVLVVHLKRFEYERSHYGFSSTRRAKIDALVDYPVTGLDLAPFIKGPQGSTGQPVLYDLYAVSQHWGGLGGGHYTSVARNWMDGRWYTFDDGHVTPLGKSGVVTESGYVLFYARRDGAVAAVAGAGVPAAAAAASVSSSRASAPPGDSDVDMDGVGPSVDAYDETETQ